MTSPEFFTNEQIIQAAKRRLSQGPWDYLVGGSESETTMRRNRLAFDKVAFRPRILVNVSDVNTSTTLLGHTLRIPVIMAPVGSLQVFDQEGGVGVTKAASEFGVLHVVSSVTQPSLEEISSAASSPKVYQLYIHGDWDWTKDMLDRAKVAGYKAICITVDTAVYSRRERTWLSRWVPMSQRTPPDPIWQASVTWETIVKIKEYSGLPLVLKGVSNRADAKLAVDHGVAVVWVSNHGGRQLDHGLGTMDFLEEIVDAVGDKVEIVLDGGIQRGSDVIKAVAMGAKAVAVGKLQGWGLAANGSSGVYRVLEILEDEIKVGMGLLGVTSMEQLNKSFVCSADPTTTPHEMSSWVNMPVSRIT